MLVVMEGIDGSGKTTQAKMLNGALARRGYKTVLLYEPTDSIYGNAIRQKLKSGNYTPEELYGLFLRDRSLNSKKIKMFLEEGYIVILDRYYISTIAYQGAQGISIERIINDHKNMPQPNLVFILDIKPEAALARLETKDTFEVLEFLNTVREIYLRIPSILNIPCCDVYIIDASKSPDEIHAEILGYVLRKISSSDMCG